MGKTEHREPMDGLVGRLSSQARCGEADWRHGMWGGSAVGGLR